MIEILSRVQQALSSSSSSKNNAISSDNSFQKRLDESLSQQKSLSDEIKQQKITDKQKEIKKISEEITNLKKEQKDHLSPKEWEQLKARLKPLEEILSFIEQALTTLENTDQTIMVEGATQSVELIDWLGPIKDFVSEAVDILNHQQTLPDSVFFSAQKFSFLLETMSGEQSLSADIPSLSQRDSNTMMSILADVQDILPKITEELVAVDTGGQKIHPDMQIVEPELVESSLEEKGSEINSLIQEDLELKGSENTDFADTSSEGNEDPKVEIKDLRTIKKTNTEKQEFSELTEATSGEVSTLESIDAEKIFSGEKIISSEPVIKNDIASVAQKLYASLSSSVSRVQVEALMQNMSGKISMILQDGGNELRMKLTPPELGQMKLSFVTNDHIMMGKIIVETQEAKMFFEQNINNLRESLALAGIELGNIEIDLGSQQDFADQEDQIAENYQAVRSSQKASQNLPVRRTIDTDLLVDFTA